MKNDNNSDLVIGTDKNFVLVATLNNHALVSAGQLALQKASHDSVRQFGQMMVTEHSTLQQNLDAIARKYGILVADGPDESHLSIEQHLYKLQGLSFDSAYLQHVIGDHQQLIAQYRNLLDRGQNRQVKEYAQQALPLFKKHQMTAKSLALH